MGYDFSKFVSKKPFTGEVEKTFDPSVIQGQFKGMTQDEIREYKRLEEESRRAISKNDSRNMGFAKAMGKDERIFQFLHAIRNKRITTVDEASVKIGVKDTTIMKYLTENNVDFDKKTGEIFGIREDEE